MGFTEQHFTSPATGVLLLHCRFMRVRSPLFLSASLASLTSVAFVTACTPSPTPNEPLVQMYQEAQFDAQALMDSSPDISFLRTQHADELLAEIHRLCGFTDEGAVPESCEVMTTMIAAAPTDDVAGRVASSQSLILDLLDDIPKESVSLVVGQYIDEARYGVAFDLNSSADSPVEMELSFDEITIAQDLLEREQSAAWALGIALAQYPLEQRDSIEVAIEAHNDRAFTLQQLLGPDHSTPAEPGYDSDLTAPTDFASAKQTIDEIENNLIDSWHAAASAATTDEWRTFCTQVAGDTARTLLLIDAS
ncbi:hypothetical protein CDES_08915 [Corynebacterium deserti GIMN1.010]|uniref:DUF4439 domain-containing protein n=2 Tax=Corynebacterium TaxID=1716 RepID=A0A0M4CXW1_9CORY|nr:hypothetical protein CDES_08915 [Corynebacterium deserti GIMN1.010]